MRAWKSMMGLGLEMRMLIEMQMVTGWGTK